MTERIALLAGFSESKGLVKGIVTSAKVNKSLLVDWVKGAHLDSKRHFLVLDNWSVHHGGNLKLYCQRRKL